MRIVLVTLDTLRADGLEKMPATSAYARRGARFERAYSATSTTQPTHASLLTGLHPWEHGVTDNGEVLHIVIPQGGYTDLDLFGFIADLKEADPDLWGVEVFDDAEAAAAFAVAEGERTDAQAQMITSHHLISLVSGDTIRYQGPFSDFGEEILGS